MEDNKEFKDDKKDEKKGSSSNNPKDGKKGADKGKGGKPKNPKSDNPPKTGNKPKQDPFFYAANEQAISDMASIAFLETVGEALPGTNNENSTSKTDLMGGIAIISYIPVPGSDNSNNFSQTEKEQNYKTRAADAYFQYVTQGFTGGVDFEAPDLLMTAISAASLFAKMKEGMRAYGCMHYYLQNNQYFAERIVTALGFNYADLKANMANFRTEYNIRVDQINKVVALPKGFTISDRWDFLSDYVFTDTADPAYSTSYAWVQKCGAVYNPTRLTTGTCLTRGEELDDPLTVDAFFAVIDQMINALTDEDTRAIFGAVRRVYSDEQLKKLGALQEDYMTTFLQHDVVAMQFHNMQWTDRNKVNFAPSDLLTDPGTTDNTDILMFQTAAGSIYSIAAQSWVDSLNISGAQQEYMLDMYDHAVNPGNILDATTTMQVATKLLIIDGTGDNPAKYGVIVCRCELIDSVYIYTVTSRERVPKYIKETAAQFYAARIPLALMAHIDSHPLIATATENGTAGEIGDVTVVRYYGEVDKYTSIASKVLRKMHLRSQYQLLSMPANSKSVTK